MLVLSKSKQVNGTHLNCLENEKKKGISWYTWWKRWQLNKRLKDKPEVSISKKLLPSKPRETKGGVVIIELRAWCKPGPWKAYSVGGRATEDIATLSWIERQKYPGLSLSSPQNSWQCPPLLNWSESELTKDLWRATCRDQLTCNQGRVGRE